MKTFLFTFVMVLGIVACGRNVTPTTEDATDSTEVVTDSVMVDTTNISGCTITDTTMVAE